MKIYGRNLWHPEGSRGSSQSGASELYVHHSDGFDRKATSAEQQAQIMRDIDDFHLHGRGWAGFAYNFALFQPHGNLKTARVWEGRGWDRIPAAQLGHNSNTVAICVIDPQGGESVSKATLKALTEFAVYARKHHGVTSLGGHRDAPGQSTECPGRFIYPHLDHVAEDAKLRRVHR